MPWASGAHIISDFLEGAGQINCSHGSPTIRRVGPASIKHLGGHQSQAGVVGIRARADEAGDKEVASDAGM